MPILRGGHRAVEGDLIVFDKDGVLLDFHRLWARTTRLRVEALCRLGACPGQAEALAAWLGLAPDGRVAADGLLAAGTRADATIAAATFLHQRAGLSWPLARAAAHQAFEDAARALDPREVWEPLPGVAEALYALAGEGWRLAIATTDRTQGALDFLQHAGWTGLFDAVVGADRVQTAKPDPAMFLLACAEAGVSPDRAVVVGDAPADLAMARAGGAAAAIGVLTGVGSATELSPGADWLVPDLGALWRMT